MNQYFIQFLCLNGPNVLNAFYNTPEARDAAVEKIEESLPRNARVSITDDYGNVFNLPLHHFAIMVSDTQTQAQTISSLQQAQQQTGTAPEVYGRAH